MPYKFAYLTLIHPSRNMSAERVERIVLSRFKDVRFRRSEWLRASAEEVAAFIDAQIEGFRYIEKNLAATYNAVLH